MYRVKAAETWVSHEPESRIISSSSSTIPVETESRDLLVPNFFRPMIGTAATTDAAPRRHQKRHSRNLSDIFTKLSSVVSDNNTLEDGVDFDTAADPDPLRSIPITYLRKSRLSGRQHHRAFSGEWNSPGAETQPTDTIGQTFFEHGTTDANIHSPSTPTWGQPLSPQDQPSHRRFDSAGLDLLTVAADAFHDTKNNRITNKDSRDTREPSSWAFSPPTSHLDHEASNIVDGPVETIRYPFQTSNPSLYPVQHANLEQQHNDHYYDAPRPTHPLLHWDGPHTAHNTKYSASVKTVKQTYNPPRTQRHVRNDTWKTHIAQPSFSLPEPHPPSWQPPTQARQTWNPPTQMNPYPQDSNLPPWKSEQDSFGEHIAVPGRHQRLTTMDLIFNDLQLQNNIFSTMDTTNKKSHSVLIPTEMESSPPSSLEPPQTRVISGGTSKRVRRKCEVVGCSNRTVQGGRCIAHGAKRRICGHPGCMKHVKKSGMCSTHGPARKRCMVDGCEKVAVQGGKCVSHGAKKKSCSVVGCSKQATLFGMCKRHHDMQNGAASTVTGQRKTSPSWRDSQVCLPIPHTKEIKDTAHHQRGLSIFHDMNTVNEILYGKHARSVNSDEELVLDKPLSLNI